MTSGRSLASSRDSRYWNEAAHLAGSHASVKYANIIDGMNLYTPERICELMEGAGFSRIESFKNDRKPWITVIGRKPE